MIHNGVELLALGLVSASGFTETDASHHSALMSQTAGATLKLEATGSQVWLRFLQHPWSGAIRVRQPGGEEFYVLKSDTNGILDVPVVGHDGRVEAEITLEHHDGGTEAWLLAGKFSDWQDRPTGTIFASRTCQLTIRRDASFLTFASDTGVGHAIRNWGGWAQEDMDLMGRHIKAGDTVLDIGSNLGTHLVAFSGMVGPTGRVIGFEPQKLVYQLACGNVALNGCRNVDLLHCGLGAEQGQARMFPIDYDADVNIGGLGIGREASGELVRIRTLDEVVETEKIDRIDFMKIDVQAYELFVLQGGARTIERFKPTIFLEVMPEGTDHAGYDYTRIYDFLRDLGYQFDHLDGSGLTTQARPRSDQPGVEWDVLALVP